MPYIETGGKTIYSVKEVRKCLNLVYNYASIQKQIITYIAKA